METVAQIVKRRVVNLNWYIFGAVLLSTGMFVITTAPGWAWVGFVSVFLFGMGTAAVVGARAIVNNEEVKER